MTIAGANLLGAIAVHFGTARAKIDKTVSAAKVKVTSPRGWGTVHVTVTASGWDLSQDRHPCLRY